MSSSGPQEREDQTPEMLIKTHWVRVRGASGWLNKERSDGDWRRDASTDEDDEDDDDAVTDTALFVSAEQSRLL